MRRLLLFMLVFFIILANSLYAQTRNVADVTSWKSDASNGNWNDNNWYNVTQGWDNHNPNYEGQRELQFDNNNQTTMTNNFDGTEGIKGYRVIFTANATTPRTITGNTENTYSAVSSNKPKIENYSTALHSIGYPIKIGSNPMEINPINGGLTFSGSISNNGNYIDVYGNNSKELTISSTLDGTGGFTIKENSKVLFTTVAKTYSGATTLSAGTLEIQVDLVNSPITVKSGATLIINGTDIDINNLTIEAGGIVQILEGKSLTVNGNLSNSGTFTLKSDATGTGSLITNGTITGDITVQRYIDRYTAPDANDGWHLISSPVDDFVVSNTNFDPTIIPGDLYYYDEVADLWRNFKTASFNFVKEKGYLCAYSFEITDEFSGTLNNSNVSISGLTLTGGGNGSVDGWNLVGNPFASALVWNKTGGGWNLSNVSATAKVFNESGANYLDVAPDGIIPAMNGFFVQVTSGTGGFTIPATSRTHSTTAWYKNSENTESVYLKVSGGENSFYDFTRVGFDAQATDEYDSQYDSHKFYGMATAPQLFTRIEDEVFSTNTFADANAQREVDMDFIPGTSGEYTIEVIENTVPASSIYLKDLVTGQMIDITANNSYTFNAEVGDNQNRFKLHFGATGINEVAKESLQAYISGQNLYILGEEGTAQLAVYDIQGRQLFEETVQLTSQFRRALELPAGVYVVSVQSKKSLKTAKVIIK